MQTQQVTSVTHVLLDMLIILNLSRHQINMEEHVYRQIRKQEGLSLTYHEISTRRNEKIKAWVSPQLTK